MTLSLYEGRKRRDDRPLLVLIIANCIFAGLVLFAWTAIALFVAEPISWATWAPLSSGSRPELFEYPFVMLWLMPLGGATAAWMTKSIQGVRWAYLSAIVPILLLSITFGYYYMVPQQFH
ncbi:MAG: hypothetical protein AAFR04_02455 [Pseudomonadota bacterium]